MNASFFVEKNVLMVVRRALSNSFIFYCHYLVIFRCC